MLNTILTKMKSFAKDETGASAIEYAVMAALLVGLIALAIVALDFNTMFTGITDGVTGAVPGGGTG